MNYDSNNNTLNHTTINYNSNKNHISKTPVKIGSLEITAIRNG